jgi:hypothetical protein
MTTHARASTQARRSADLVLIACFVALLLAPTVDLFVRDDDARGPGPELRRPAPRPELPQSGRDLLTFPRRYEAYWSDSFGLRDKLLRGHSALKVLALGVSPDPMHVVGKQGWIYNTNDQMIDVWRGALPFGPEQLESWRARLERRRSAVAAIGAHYLFVVVPDKPEIYPEFMPERFNKVGPSRLDQLYEHLRAHGSVDVLDLRPALLAEKQRDQPGDYVYFRLGTHWDLRGAIAGYNAFVGHLRPRFPTLPFLPLEEHRLLDSDNLGDSEAAAMYIADLMPQRQHYYALGSDSEFRTLQPRRDGSNIFVTEQDDAQLPRVVIFHDSFGGYFQDQWATAAAHLVMHNNYDFDLGDVAAHDPDLVIEMVVERALVFQRPEQRTVGESHTLSDRFASTSRVVYALDPAASALKPLRKAVATRANDEHGAFVRLEAKTKGCAFELQGVAPQVGPRVLARVVLDSDQVGKLALMWRCEGEEGWRNSRKAERTLSVGRNELFLVLRPGRKPIEALQLGLFPRPGAWRLRSLELRVEDVY